MNGGDERGMDVVVRTCARWLKGFILLYGIYVVLHGHLTPGGGFAGGVVIACGFILVCLARGGEHAATIFSRHAASRLDSIGVLAFLSLACYAMARSGGAFLENFLATPASARFDVASAGVIPLANVALGLKVASSLFLAFAVLAAFRIVGAARSEEDDER